MSPPSSKAAAAAAATISSPQVHFKIAAEHVKKDSEKAGTNGKAAAVAAPAPPAAPPVTRAVGSLNPFLASVPVTAQVTRKQPFILSDGQGNEKSFGSALGLLTRKFVNIIHASHSGTVDMNETALLLQVPKRRIYDITNVLEGVGLIEKRSKNTVAWKGSEAILGDALDKESKDKMGLLRKDIENIFKEEAMLEQSINKIWKLPFFGQPMNTSDIVKAVFYPEDDKESVPTKEDLADEAGKPRRAILAVHAPFDTIAHVPTLGDEDANKHQLYIGTRTGLSKYGSIENGKTIESCDPKKRKLPLKHRKSAKAPRVDEKLKVFLMPTVYDEKEEKMKSLGTRLLSQDPAVAGAAAAGAAAAAAASGNTKGSEKEPGWEVAESMANDEGVSEFFASGMPEESEEV